MSVDRDGDSKRKLSSNSGDTPENKNARHGDSPSSSNVIDSIREANSVLLNESITELCPDMATQVLS